MNESRKSAFMGSWKSVQRDHRSHDAERSSYGIRGCESGRDTDGKRKGQLDVLPEMLFLSERSANETVSAKPRYVCRACQPSKKILKQYYEDRESRNLFDAIHRERERERTQKQAGQNP